MEKERYTSIILRSLEYDENVIRMTLRSCYKSGKEFINGMKDRYRITFGEEEEDIIRYADFAPYFGQNLEILIIKGSVFEGLKMYPLDTLYAAKAMGHDISPIIISCLLFEMSFGDSRLQGYRFIITIHDMVKDNDGVPCFLCVSTDRKPEMLVYYDEKIAGLYAGSLDAYAFGHIED